MVASVRKKRIISSEVKQAVSSASVYVKPLY